MTITDAAGEIVTPHPRLGHESEIFAAEPTTYTVRIERPDRATFEQTVDFSGLHAYASSPDDWNIVLPE